MSEGNRSGAIVLGLALAFGAVFAIGVWSGQTDSHYQYPSTQAEQQAYADAQHYGAVLGLDGSTGALTYQQICSDPHGKDDAELCQEWRAANYARDQSRWSFWQLVLSLLGLLGLGFTVWWARSAVIHAKSAVEKAGEANQIARWDRRAWIRIAAEEERIQVDITDLSIGLMIAARMTNIGETPAQRARVRYSLIPVGRQWDAAQIRSEHERVMSDTNESILLFPQQEHTTVGRGIFRSKRDIFSRLGIDSLGGVTSYFLIFEAVYVISGDDRPHRTGVPYLMHIVGPTGINPTDNGSYVAVLRVADWGAWQWAD